MNFIQNVSMGTIAKGQHMDAGGRGILIQIGDPGAAFPIPKFIFEQIHKFEFLDIDDKEFFSLKTGVKISATQIPEWEFRMTEEQAKDIVSILRQGLEEKRNVIVHCHAGICRSGAVAEVGEMLGFQPGHTSRIPNVWVKKLLMKELGWTYENDQILC